MNARQYDSYQRHQKRATFVLDTIFAIGIGLIVLGAILAGMQT